MDVSNGIADGTLDHTGSRPDTEAASSCHAADSPPTTREANCRASVVVDLPSCRRRLEALSPAVAGERFQAVGVVDLVRLARLLTASGVIVTEMSVAAPFLHVRLGAGDDPHRGRKYSEETRLWWDQQVKAWQRSEFRRTPLHPLLGATNGEREVGIDAMVAAGALDAVGRFAKDDVPTGTAGGHRVVLICSHDSDLYGLHGVGENLPIVVAGAFASAEVELLDAGRVPTLPFSKDHFLGISASSKFDFSVDDAEVGLVGGDSAWFGILRKGRPGKVVVAGTTDSASVTSSSTPNHRVGSPTPSAHDAAASRTVVVTDTNGTLDTQTRTLAAVEMPGVDKSDAAAVRSIVAALGWKNPEVLVHPKPVDDRLGPHRNRSVSSSTGLTTAAELLCDLWVSAMIDPTADLVVISEDPDLAFVLDMLPAAQIDTYSRVVRVGVDADRYRLVICHRKPVGHRRSPGRSRQLTTFVPLPELQLSA